MSIRLEPDVRRAVLRAAEEEARALGSTTVEAEHLLLSLAAVDTGAARRLLVDAGVDRDGIAAALEREVERSLAAVGVVLGDYTSEEPARTRRRLGLATSAKRALERAARAALARKHRRVTGPHLLVGILAAEVGTVPRALAAADIDRVALLTRAERLLAP
jgi:ATP-dependent Clp protease ATP-binding subunit ClpA